MHVVRFGGRHADGSLNTRIRTGVFFNSAPAGINCQF